MPIFAYNIDYKQKGFIVIEMLTSKKNSKNVNHKNSTQKANKGNLDNPIPPVDAYKEEKQVVIIKESCMKEHIILYSIEKIKEITGKIEVKKSFLESTLYFFEWNNILEENEQTFHMWYKDTLPFSHEIRSILELSTNISTDKGGVNITTTISQDEKAVLLLSSNKHVDLIIEMISQQKSSDFLYQKVYKTLPYVLTKNRGKIMFNTALEQIRKIRKNKKTTS